MPIRAVFAFDRENWCHVFRSADEAAAQLEVADVEADEYVLFGDDGSVFVASVDGQHVVVRPTESRDPEALRERLGRYCAMAKIETGSDDPVVVGNAILADSWSHRWPKRPSWLDRRVHGDAPPRL